MESILQHSFQMKHVLRHARVHAVRHRRSEHYGVMQLSAFQQVMDLMEQLPSEDQAAVVDVFRRRLTEQRRAEIACNATATLHAIRHGKASQGTIDDLKNDLLGESL